MQKERLEYLFNRYVSGTADPGEVDEFKQLLQLPDSREPVEKLVEDLLEKVPGIPLPEENIPATLQAIFQATPAQLVPMRKRNRWLRVAAAAIVFLVLGAGTWFLVMKRTADPSTMVKTSLPVDVKAPDKNRAMITLADGQHIYLDSAANGALIQQGTVSLVKKGDGQVEYNDSQLPAPGSQLVYNTLTNPRGSKVVSLTLGDGTRVWLNAESSLTYPVAFSGNERKVSITGEAYFEVAHDSGKPFYVGKGDMNIKVLGTKFNVNAYDDEQTIKVSLLEGSVNVSSVTSGKSSILKSGQQAELYNSAFSIHDNIDLDDVTAWINGRFELNGSTIEPLMRQVARWYDVEVEYRGEKPTVNFMGGTSRQENVSQLLKILEQTKAVKFDIQDRKIIVTKGD